MNEELSRIKNDIYNILEKENMTERDLEHLYYLTQVYECVSGWKKDKENDESYIKMTPEIAEQWMHNTKNSDGTTGEHWSMEKIDEVKKSRGIDDVSTAVYYAAMNMLYSDYAKVFSKYGIGDTHNIWAEMTEAWLYDKDAKKNKTSLYYEFIVCK